ncbi:MAG: LytTR family DNA-binding domain-containing protein [Bacteroidota bacterium]
MRTIIIDDEKDSHDSLRKLLKRFPSGVEIAHSAFTVEEGIQSILDHGPDLVFLDIELGDGLGFDILDRLDSLNFQVIFITAYDKYAIRAIRAGALDYLLKPIDQEELENALKRATLNKKIGELPNSDQWQIFWDSLKYMESQLLPSRVAVSTLEGIIFQQVKDIVRLEADMNYTQFFILNQEKPLVASLNLGEFEQIFDPYQNFMRVHRSHLVNLNYVRKFIKRDRLIYMEDGSEVRISANFMQDFLKVMEKV